MKKLLSFLAIAATIAATQSASADVITSVVVSDGTTLTTLSTTSSDPVYAGTSAVIQEFTAGGVTYNTFVGADTWADGGNNSLGVVEATMAAIGANPALITASDALGDLDLSTGTLDPLGTGGNAAAEYHNFASQTIASDTVFFLFNNGTQTSSVTLVDTAGAAISNALDHGTTLGGEVILNNFGFSRTNGGDLTSRDVAGNIFAVSEFTFTGANTVADVAGFRGAGSTFDGNDAGIASVTTVPEPSSAMLLVGGLGAFLVRRRK